MSSKRNGETAAAERPAGTVAPAPGRPRARGLAIAAVLGAALIWSSSYAVTKVALAEIPPLTIGALRFVSAAVILGVIVHARWGLRLPSRRDGLLIAVAGLLGITVYFAVENVGVDLATASDATLIVASYPIVTLLLELVCRQARFSPVRLFGMLLAIVGVWLVVQNGYGTGGGEHHLVGDLLLLLGGVVWAGYNVVVKRDQSGTSPIVVTYYQTVAGGAGFVLLSLFESGSWSAPSPGAWLRIAFLSVFCSIVAFLLYNYGLSLLPSSVAVNLLNIVPVLGLVWAVVLAGETLSLMQVAGGAVVIIGVTLGLMNATTPRHDRTNEAAEESGIR